MATQILNLPLLSFTMTVSTNEDWLDSWAYVDASANPISLAGLTLNFVVKLTPASFSPAVLASTASTIATLPVNGTVASGGTGGNVAALNIPRATMQLIAAGPYFFEMQAVGDGETRTIAAGTVTINKGLVP